MNKYTISIRPFGKHAMLIEWPNKVDEGILGNILQYQDYLMLNHLAKEDWEMIPAYNSLTLIQRNTGIKLGSLKSRLIQWYEEMPERALPQRFLWRLPVCYDLDFGLDLRRVSKKLKLDVKDIIALHTQYTYTVFGIGFLPGFMYLGGLPRELEVPRLPEPRPNVKKGSVGLAGEQTGVYPQDSPGGWNIIGKCPIPMFEPEKDDPCFVNVGDKVQFYSIERAEYDLHKIEGEVGIYKLEKSKWNA